MWVRYELKLLPGDPVVLFLVRLVEVNGWAGLVSRSKSKVLTVWNAVLILPSRKIHLTPWDLVWMYSLCKELLLSDKAIFVLSNQIQCRQAPAYSVQKSLSITIVHHLELIANYYLAECMKNIRLFSSRTRPVSGPRKYSKILEIIMSQCWKYGLCQRLESNYDNFK